MGYFYKMTEPNLVWTVGVIDESGAFEPESDHSDPDEAADRVSYLNGVGSSLRNNVTSLQRKHADLMRQNVILRNALGLLGVQFCACCGEAMTVEHDNPLHLSDELGNVVAIHMQPESLHCFLGTMKMVQEDVDEDRLRPFPNLTAELAAWIIDSCAYQTGSPYQGALHEVLIQGIDDRFTGADLAVALIRERINKRRFLRPVPGETPRDLISMCGWDTSDEEWNSILGSAAAH